MKSNTISLKQRLFTLSLHRTLSPNYNDDFTSPVPHLLNSNAVPTDSERRLIQDAVDRVSVLTGDILEALHGGIASERETGFKLDGGKPRLEAGLEFLRVHKAILSPVRQLPAEILAEIISINAESFLLNPHPRLVLDSSNPVNFPWSPSQVSRFWRETTLSLHHLWGQLIIDACLLKGKKPSKAFLKFFTLCLERSQDAPLHIYLCSPTRQPEDLTPFLDLLMAHAERWQTLYLLTKPSFLNALEGVRDRLSSLTRLYVSFSYDETEGADRQIDLFQVTPKLRDVYVGGFSFGNVLLPWSQIKLFVDAVGPHQGFARTQVMESSPLTDLRLLMITMADISKVWPKTRLEHVRNIDIHFDLAEDDNDPDDGVTDNFLPCLELPSVENIKITNYPVNALPALTSFISHSFQGTHLQELEMSTYYLHDIGEGELSSFFQLTPHLTKLSIYLPSRTDVLNMVYYPGSSTPLLLPNLEELYLFVYESVAGYEVALSQLALSRCELDPRTDTDQSSSSIMSGKCRRLQHMRIVLPGAVLCNYAQELLEGHASIDELDEMEKERLRILKDWSGIVNCMPDTFSYFELTSPPKIPLKIRRALQISHFFSAIEGVQVESVRELYQSDIHHLMYHVHNLSSSDIPGENRYNFRKRAKVLLDKWSVLLMRDIHDRRWAFQGTHSIVYVRKDDAIRKSPDVLEFLIFGQNFNPEKYATTWHDLQQLLRFLD